MTSGIHSIASHTTDQLQAVVNKQVFFFSNHVSKSYEDVHSLQGESLLNSWTKFPRFMNAQANLEKNLYQGIQVMHSAKHFDPSLRISGAGGRDRRRMFGFAFVKDDKYIKEEEKKKEEDAKKHIDKLLKDKNQAKDVSICSSFIMMLSSSHFFIANIGMKKRCSVKLPHVNKYNPNVVNSQDDAAKTSAAQLVALGTKAVKQAAAPIPEIREWWDELIVKDGQINEAMVGKHIEHPQKLKSVLSKQKNLEKPYLLLKIFFCKLYYIC